MDSLGNNELILASVSPRRKELLSQAGFKFKVIASAFDETSAEVEDPEKLAQQLAFSKAEQVAQQFPESLVLGADTIVVLPGEAGAIEILGKPADEAQARAMLGKLSKRAHLVITAFALFCVEKEINIKKSVSTIVNFRELGEAEISNYLSTPEPYDKAGAYGIQGFAGCFVSSIEGSYSNVVGLPLSEVTQELEKLGVERF
jgi:septum formation protein